jgi:hypothetical protein
VVAFAEQDTPFNGTESWNGEPATLVSAGSLYLWVSAGSLYRWRS